MAMTVVRSGPFTTVQDLGRRGHRGAGVPLGGAMDPFALRVANLLVGNAETVAGLEFAMVGPDLEFSRDTVVAVGGAECEGLPSWRRVVVRGGERVSLGRCVRGARGYLAVAGGIDVEPVLGSRSTYLRGKFGGWHGRALRNADVLNIGEGDPQAGPVLEISGGESEGGWRIDARILPGYSPSPTVRVIRGAQADDFGTALFETSFRLSAHCDRMGFRLESEPPIRGRSRELVSVAVAPGTIQIPPDGQPVVLMADAQTIGGYAQAAHIIGVDQPVMAQLRPGDSVRFAEVALHEAHRLVAIRERALAMLREGLAEKLRFRVHS